MKDTFTFSAVWSQEDKEWVATCAEYPSLSWLDTTKERAQAGLLRLLADIIEGLA